MKKKFEQIRSIKNISIPDDDVAGWMEVFRKLNMSPDEIDQTMARLNRTYRIQKKKELSELKLQEVIGHLRKNYNKELTQFQKDELRKSIEADLEK